MAEQHAVRTAAQTRRTRILEAARERFLEHGLAGTSTRDIADAADIPESSMFRHFATKDQLFEQAVADRLEELLRGARAVDVSALAGAASPADRLAALVGMHRHYLEVMQETAPLLGAAMFAEREAGRRIYRTRVQPLLDGMAASSPAAMRGWAAPDADPAVMIHLAFGAYLLVGLDGWFRGVPPDHAAVAERIAWLIQYGVRGEPAGVRPPPPAEVPPVPEPDAPVAGPPARGGLPPGRQRRLRSDAIANRARLLDAAREQFFARGLGGAATRVIAESAGTTESALFRHFGSKEALFEQAVADRLREIVRVGLAAAATGLADLPDDDTRLRLLERQHLHYLRVIEETAPLLGAALFAERAVGARCYREIVHPFLARMSATTHAALRPWANPGADGATVILVAFGGYLLLALDAYFGDRPLRHEELAAKIARLLYRGMSGS